MFSEINSFSDISPLEAPSIIRLRSVLPLTIIHEDNEHRDGIDISKENFYQILETSQRLPTSSQVTVNMYTELFNRCREDGYTDLIQVTLHKLFTEYYGITPSDYILKIRISAAKQLLITKDDSLARIAADCGFSSQSYFNYSFKKQTGLSPLKYRKKMLSQIDI